MQQSNDETNKPLILIVDDDKDFRAMMKIALEKYGFQVAEAEDGNKALDLLYNLKPKPSLILLDMVMPNMNGLDTLFNFKMHPVGKDIKVIMLTNKLDIKEELGQLYTKMVKKFGGLEFISKTEDLPTIIQKINNSLNITNNIVNNSSK
ncbi:MAG: hypothetical protein KatS3mg097_596 [Candidatus Parcubacteria bacterium]|nr:MAG: hypothetical protein KatS3mg097_596 [Candidatus Parcubacteria bacterium]